MMFYVNINYWSHKNRLYITCFLYMLWHYKHICIYTVVSLIYISIKVHGFQFIMYMNFCTKDLSIHFNVMILISLNEHLILLVESVKSTYIINIQWKVMMKVKPQKLNFIKYHFEFLSYSIFEVIMTVCWLGSVSFYRVLVLIALHFGNSLQKSESLTAF